MKVNSSSGNVVTWSSGFGEGGCAATTMLKLGFCTIHAHLTSITSVLVFEPAGDCNFGEGVFVFLFVFVFFVYRIHFYPQLEKVCRGRHGQPHLPGSEPSLT